jgi:exodeoxyribonuclease VII large subunit
VNILEQRRSRLGNASARLASLSPLAVLGRGYAVIFDGNGALVRDAAQLRPGDTLRSRLSRGSATSTVTETHI